MDIITNTKKYYDKIIFNFYINIYPEVFLVHIPTLSAQSVKHWGLTVDRIVSPDYTLYITKKLSLIAPLRLIKTLISNKHNSNIKTL